MCILSFSDDTSYNVSLFNTSLQQQYPPRASYFDELVIEIINDLRFSRADDDLDIFACTSYLASVIRPAARGISTLSAHISMGARTADLCGF